MPQMHPSALTTEKKISLLWHWISFLLCMKDFKTVFENFTKGLHQSVFLTSFARNFGVFGLWCTTATICKLKNSLGGWAL